MLLLSVLILSSPSVSQGKPADRPGLYVDLSMTTLSKVTKTHQGFSVYHCTVAVKNLTAKPTDFRLKLSIPRGKWLWMTLHDTSYGRSVTSRRNESFFIWPYQIEYYRVTFFTSMKESPKVDLANLRIPGKLEVVQARETHLGKTDGVYIGVEPMTSLLQGTQWFHQNRLVIHGQTVTLDQSPRFFKDGQVLSSASTGGFYSYRGLLDTQGKRLALKLKLHATDYGGIDAVAEKPLAGPVVMKGGRLLFNGVLYRRREKVIADLVQNVHYQNYDQTFYDLAQEPLLAVPLLIKELHPVNETALPKAELAMNPKLLHIIRSLQILRYITGQDFTARTTEAFGPDLLEQTRKLCLTKEVKNKEYKFIAAGFSDDNIYLAPMDAQVYIIQKWIDWYRMTGQFGRYAVNDDPRFWYQFGESAP
jgi:hypothetical protein